MILNDLCSMVISRMGTLHGTYSQYLNCRGYASPHQGLVSPHRNLASPYQDCSIPSNKILVLSIKTKHLDNYTKNLVLAPIFSQRQR